MLFLQSVANAMLQEQSATSSAEHIEQLSLLLSNLPHSNENSPKSTRQTFPPENSPKRTNLFTKGKIELDYNENSFNICFAQRHGMYGMVNS